MENEGVSVEHALEREPGTNSICFGGGASQVHTICQEMVVVCGLHVPAHSNYRGGTPGLS
jgi:hypothetical protein